MEPEEGTGMNLHTPTFTASQPLPSTRRELRRHLRGQPASIRAKVAAEILNGRWPYEPSVAEVAAVVETHPRCVRAALGRHPKPPSDAEIDRFVRLVGPDRLAEHIKPDVLMAALDRHTSPTFSF
jgi:hypothetical protein